ncbi:MAG: bifunctional diguanylate cyclase/phosphodiesterase [Gammaproteobacteria bacterium]|nr:bifunctional diguanylate cyclase/phosphodiesterase [Gammaproteobacteria bacterium]
MEFSTSEDPRKNFLFTGVYDRFQLNAFLEKTLDQVDEDNSTLYLLVVNIEHFKAVNDSLGHYAGDMLFVEIINRLKTCVRDNDVIARLNDDTFAILLTDIHDEEYVCNIAKKIIFSISEPYHLLENLIHTGCSVGIALYPFKDASHDSLLQNAQMAMHRSRELGLNRYHIFSEELYEKNKQQSTIKNELKYAIEKNQLYLTYQPMFHLKTNHFAGMQALLSWHHPTLGVVSPSVFFPFAEEIGLMYSIGNWMLRAVCEQGAKWREMGHKNVKISLPIFAQQLLREGFAQILQDIFQHIHFPSDQLTFEITESAMFSCVQLSEYTIKNIDALRIHITLNHFGAGSSSFSHLTQLPIKNIKIDNVLMSHMQEDRNEGLIKSIIQFSQNMDLGVIASGIETKEQLKFLIKNNCTLGQGGYLCQPLSISQMTQFLENQIIGTSP